MEYQARREDEARRRKAEEVERERRERENAEAEERLTKMKEENERKILEERKRLEAEVADELALQKIEVKIAILSLVGSSLDIKRLRHHDFPSKSVLTPVNWLRLPKWPRRQDGLLQRRKAGLLQKRK